MTFNEMTVRAPAMIDPLNVDAFAAELAGSPANAALKIDATDVTFIDSSGLRVLIEARTRQVEGGGHFMVINPSPAVTRLLELTGLSELLLTGIVAPN
ncbi:MAG: STAS domain-containing protein [Aquihabitans sp.]